MPLRDVAGLTSGSCLDCAPVHPGGAALWRVDGIMIASEPGGFFLWFSPPFTAHSFSPEGGDFRDVLAQPSSIHGQVTGA